MSIPLARIVVIDDPTPYRNRRTVRHDGGATRFGVGVAQRYSKGVMTEPDMIALGTLIRSICAPDAYILPWATRPNKDMAHRILAGRGLNYCTEPFTWVKTTKNGKLFRGYGSYNFSNPEDLLLGRYPGAKLWHPNTGWKPDSVYIEPHPRYPVLLSDPRWPMVAPRVPVPVGDTCPKDCRCRRCLAGKIISSRKPEVFQDVIGRWLDPYIDGYSKVELFATRARPGWICLGYDVTGRDIRDDLRELAQQMGVEGIAA